MSAGGEVLGKGRDFFGAKEPRKNNSSLFIWTHTFVHCSRNRISTPSRHRSPIV